MNDVFVKVGLVFLLLIGLYIGEQHIETIGYDRRALEDAAAIAKQKAQAAATLASETEKTRTAEQALQTIKDNQELKDADHQKTVTDLSDRLRRIAGPAGRLRDPNAIGCRAGSGSPAGEAAGTAGDRPKDGAEAGGLLSTELSGLLRRLQREADDINDAYASCRADAFAVRQ